MNADSKTWGRVVSGPFRSWKVGSTPNPYHLDYLTGIRNTLARRWPWPWKSLRHTYEVLFPRQATCSPLGQAGGGGGGGWGRENMDHMYLQSHMGILRTCEKNCAATWNCTTLCLPAARHRLADQEEDGSVLVCVCVSTEHLTSSPVCAISWNHHSQPAT